MADSKLDTRESDQDRTPAPRPHRVRRWLLRALAGVFLLTALLWTFLGLAAPGLLRDAAGRWAHGIGRQLSMGDIRITPWNMSVELKDVKLAEGDGQPLFAAKRVFLNADLHTLLIGRWQAAEFTLDTPQLWLERDRNGQWNWARLISDAAGPPRLEDSAGPEKLPRLKIDQLNLLSGQVRLHDRYGLDDRFKLMPIQLQLTDLSTLQENGSYTLHAEMGDGARFDWKGSMRLQPLQSSGEASMQGLQLASFWGYVQPYFAVPDPKGSLSLKARYQFDMSGKAPELTVSPFSAELTQLEMQTPDGGSRLVLPELKLQNGSLDLARSVLRIGQLELNHGALSARRDAAGKVDWLRALPAAPAAAPAGGKPSPWLVKADNIRLNDWRYRFHDQSFAAPLQVDTAMPQFATRLSLSPDNGLAFDNLNLSLADLKIGDGKKTLLALSHADLAPTLISLQRRRIEPGRLNLAGLDLALERNRQGALNLQSQFAPRAPAPRAKAGDAGKPWQLRYPLVQLRDSQVRWLDATLPKPVSLALSQLNGEVQVENDTQLLLNLDGRLQKGKLALEMAIDAAAGSAHGNVKANALPLSPLAPYLLSGTPLRFAGGELSSELQLNVESASRWKASGGVKVAQLSIMEPGEKLPLLGWRELSLDRLQLQGMPLRVSIHDARVTRPQARLVLDAQRQLNFQRLFASQGAGKAPAKPAKAGPLPQVDVRAIHIQGGAVEFADHGMKPDFATRMHNLRGSIQNLSTSGQRGNIALDGEVDQYGDVKVRGALSPLSPTDNTDIRLAFRNIALNSLNPYSMNFAGWQVTDGRLSIDLRYLLERRQLKGENRIVIDSIQLGEELKGDQGPHLPLRLAVALLEDSDGRIDLDLPVAGSLDDPQFSYGQVVWKAIVNVVTKVVTAPFRALGALIGGEGFDDIRFVAGEASVTPPEREKLDKVAAVMAKRPRMQLEIRGGYNASVDRKELARAQVDQAVLEAAGHKPMAGEPLPTLDLQDRKLQGAMRGVYAQRIGRLKLLGHTLNPNGPSGAELAKTLHEEMLAATQIGDADLQQLAKKRAENARRAMLRADASLADRIAVGEAAKVSAGRDGIPLEIKLTSK
ncbi:hypothetical protein CEK28_12225 [Xenophilus sp. AP218F]|nr:hypothetical protein CEK28_12225 [Xenophilus sp. AP218F]